MPLYKCDDHMHPFEHCRSKDGMRQFVLVAQERGFDEICFTKHGPLPCGMNDGGMSESELEDYVRFTLELRKEFSPIRIKLGLELNYYPDIEKYLASLIRRHPFDYVIGSVHIHTAPYAALIEGKSFDGTVKIALNLEQDAVKSGLFDTLAHLDFFRWLCDPARFNRFKDSTYEPERYKDQILNLLHVLENRNVCVEVNSSGLKKSFGQILPCPAILSWAKKFNLHYTFGSDAHMANHVGDGYHEALATMFKTQRRCLVTFRDRKPVCLSDARDGAAHGGAGSLGGG